MYPRCILRKEREEKKRKKRAEKTRVGRFDRPRLRSTRPRTRFGDGQLSALVPEEPRWWKKKKGKKAGGGEEGEKKGRRRRRLSFRVIDFFFSPSFFFSFSSFSSLFSFFFTTEQTIIRIRTALSEITSARSIVFARFKGMKYTAQTKDGPIDENYREGRTIDVP